MLLKLTLKFLATLKILFKLKSNNTRRPQLSWDLLCPEGGGGPVQQVRVTVAVRNVTGRTTNTSPQETSFLPLSLNFATQS